jgi:transposase
MRKRIYVRPLTDEEEQAVRAGLKSSQAFTMRRSQIILASNQGKPVPEISKDLGCSEQCVRDAIHAFDKQGIEVLRETSSRPHTIRRKLTSDQAKTIAHLAHRSPRDFGQPTSIWTLRRLVQVSLDQGILLEQISGEALRQGLRGQGIQWSRMKSWITSPDRDYARKKTIEID